jgi:hypothetical protein
MLNAVLSNLCAVEAMIIHHAGAAAESTVLDRFGVVSDLPAPVVGVCSQLTTPCAKDMPSAFFEVRGRNILSRSFTVFY